MRMRRNVLLMNSQVYFTNNGDLEIDLGEFLSLSPSYAVNHLSYNCGARNH